VLSLLADTKRLPSDVNCAELMESLCPLRTAFPLPVLKSHNFTVPEPPPQANVFPSGESATHSIRVMPLSIVAFSVPFATSQSLTVPSPLQETKSLPSGVNATEPTYPLCPFSTAFCLRVGTSHSLTSASRP